MKLLDVFINYYRNFWNIYRLEYKASRLLAPKISQKREGFSLIALDNGDICAFLDDLKSQTRQPDEVLIVCRSRQLNISIDTHPKLTLLPAYGLSIGAALNLGIAAAGKPIVVTMEANFHPDERLLEELIKPIEGNYSMGISAPQLKQTSFLKWFSSPYIPQTISPLASSQVVAFRKIFWARAGGIPEDISPFAAWSVFLSRLLKQEFNYFQSEIEVEFPADSKIKVIFSTAVEEGKLGLFAAWAWDQVKFGLITFILYIATVILLISSASFGILPAISSLSISAIWLFIWGTKSGGFTPLALQRGWFGFIRFTGYLYGVCYRAQTLSLLNLQAERHLKEIIDAHPNRKGIILYFPTHDWGNMFQRPHQVARQFAKAGYLFFYGTRNEAADQVAEFQKVEPNLYLVSMPAVPPETFRIAEPVILYIGATWHAPMLNIFQKQQTIYDHYDDLSVSGGTLLDHEFLLKYSTIVLASSHLLMEAVERFRPDALYIPNAVDEEWVVNFEPRPSDIPPSDLESVLRLQKPIIGYSGALAEWFDYSLLKETAQLLPDFEFVIIGIDYDGSLDSSSLLQNENIHWLGQKPYTELFHYIWRFDVAIIPFKLNEITLATSPIKLYEYFCCGKPVVSTPLPEVVRYNQVLIAKTAFEFVQQIRQAYKLAFSPEYQKDIQVIAHVNTWKQRVHEIINRLK